LSALKGAQASQKHIEIFSVDASQDALSLAQENMSLNENNLSQNASIEWIKSDVFDYLKQCRLSYQAKQTEAFDLIVLDPPKFASSSRQIDQAARAYKQINLEALKLLKQGGVLLTFSCSGAIDTSLFRKIVAGAVSDARIDCVIEKQLSQPLDHPIHMAFPEGEYLKGLLLRKIS
jgi:23S rRNA (cytosine1962-C5)-methyltransferase